MLSRKHWLFALFAAAAGCSAAPAQVDGSEATATAQSADTLTPIPTSIYPARGWAGDTAQVCGVNFATSAVTGMQIRIGNSQADYYSIDCSVRPGCCSFTVPPHVLSSDSEVEVRTVTSSVTTLWGRGSPSLYYAYNAPEIFESSTPMTGDSAGGGTIRLSGKGLVAGSKVMFFEPGSGAYYWAPNADCSTTSCIVTTPTLSAADQATVRQNGTLAMVVYAYDPGLGQYSNQVPFTYIYGESSTPTPTVASLSVEGAPTALWTNQTYFLDINFTASIGNIPTTIALDLPSCVTTSPASAYVQAKANSSVTTIQMTPTAACPSNWANLYAEVNGGTVSLNSLFLTGDIALYSQTNGLGPGQTINETLYVRSGAQPSIQPSPLLTFTSPVKVGDGKEYTFKATAPSAIPTATTATIAVTAGGVSTSQIINLVPPSTPPVCTQNTRACCVARGCAWTRSCQCGDPP
jgi:hypothetical protein